MDLQEQLSKEQLVSLIALYQDEWLCRDDSMWRRAIQMFIAALFVMFVPHLVDVLDRGSLCFSNTLFYALGIAVAIVSVIILLAAQRRIKIIGDTIRKLYGYFPSDYQRDEVTIEATEDDSKIKRIAINVANVIIKAYLNTVLLVTMFSAVGAVGILLIIYQG